MFNKPFTALLLIWHVGSLLACWGGGKKEKDPRIKNLMLDPNNKIIWGGWNPPAGAPAAWSSWLANYNAQNLGKGQPYDPSIHGDHPYGHDDKGWPPDWGGLGPPIEGMHPPPWAYVPKNMGKPSFCYDPPEYGHCDKPVIRWGFNGYMEECQQFTYSGCGANRNNFVELESCKKACMSAPESGCENDSKLPVDSLIWSRRCGYSDDEPSDYVAVKNY